MIPLIIDTDVGTFVDDWLALALALESPEIDLRAVTTVEGDARARARLAASFLQAAGRPDVLVAAGADDPLLRRMVGRWAGYEPDSFPDLATGATAIDRRHAAQALIDLVRPSPGQMTVLAIGPLTNLALALTLEPGLSSAVRQAVLMGGSLRTGEGWQDVPVAEWNFAGDPEAAALVLDSGMPIVVVPYDVGGRWRFPATDLPGLQRSPSPTRRALAAALGRARALRGAGDWYVFDPMALAYLIDASLFATEEFHLEVLTGAGRQSGMLTAERPEGDKGANALVVTDVDVPRIEQLMRSRLVGSEG